MAKKGKVYDLKAAHDKVEVRGQADSNYQLTLSGWGVAAVIAGLQVLLEQDVTMRQEQRLAVTAMVGEMRKTLKGENG